MGIMTLISSLCAIHQLIGFSAYLLMPLSAVGLYAILFFTVGLMPVLFRILFCVFGCIYFFVFCFLPWLVLISNQDFFRGILR